MDDPADRSHSRAPELEDLTALCAALNREGARYIVIGGFAVILHGWVRSTKDIDLLIDVSEENVRAVKRALASLPDNAAALMADDEPSRYPVVRVADEIVVDLMSAACRIDYSQALALGIDTAEVEGVRIPIAKKDVLIRMKDTVRETDAADVRFLKLRLAEEGNSEP